MKTNTLLRTSMGILAGGFFAAVALAGPSPQYWNRPAAKPAVVKANEAAKCGGCQTTPIWTSTERAPAGKGAPAARITGYAHACNGCAGQIATNNGKTTTDMKHGAGCATMACCK